MPADLSSLVSGDRVAVAQALNDAEDRRPEARARTTLLLSQLAATRASERAHRVGITGPPGVGKSSLVAAMTRVIRGESPPRSVGVLAVDPSSRASGGALLGDRIRIATDSDDTGLFVRSLATRGELGGLARAIPSEVLVLAAAFDVVVVETVGVGQSETDVRDVVDTLVLVLQPGAGDTLQHLKSGVMEAPDVFVVNKADESAAAEKTRSELHAALLSLAHAGVTGRTCPIVLTSALGGTGVTDLVDTLGRLHEDHLRTGEVARRRHASVVARSVREVARRYGELGVERLGGEDRVRASVDAAVRAGESMEALVDRLNPFVPRGP